jgi:hypothetical protein
VLPQLHTLGQKAVQIRSWSIPAVKCHVRPAQVIRDDKHEVGAFLGTGDHRNESQKRTSYVFQHVDSAVRESSVPEQRRLLLQNSNEPTIRPVFMGRELSRG